jgi:hypothetical protein
VGKDHVLSGVLLTMRDRFFSRGDYQMLLYSSLHSVRSRSDIKLEPPCIWKPARLWSGKQVISTVVKHLLVGRPLFNYRGAARVKWDDPYEDFVLFRGGELLCGVLDKVRVFFFVFVFSVSFFFRRRCSHILDMVVPILFWRSCVGTKQTDHTRAHFSLSAEVPSMGSSTPVTRSMEGTLRSGCYRVWDASSPHTCSCTASRAAWRTSC